MITQPTDVPSGNNTKVSGSNTESLVPNVTQSHISNQASTSSHPVPQDRWSRDQHIELVNIISDPGEGMLTRSMAAKLTAASASKCLFVDFLSKIEPKKVSDALKYLGWVDSMNKKYENVARMEAIRIFLAFSTYMNFNVYQMDVKSFFLSGTKGMDDKGISICQEQYTKNLLKKYEISDSSSVITPMVPPNNLGPDLVGKPVNETSYRGMIRSLMYLTAQAGLSNSPQIHVQDISFDLKGYSDSDYADCNIDRKSTSGACQILGGKLVCWSAKKQQSMAMSSGEAEYVVALSDYDIYYKMVPIFCDNTSAIAISNNLVLHSRTKHIDIRYHFIRDHIHIGDIELNFIPTEYQLADIFTKPLDEPTFTRLKKDSVSPLPLATKPKKGKSQTMTPTLPKSQGPEIPGALSKKSKRPKSKKPPTETKVTPPKPTEGSEQSHSVSSGTVPDPQDLERNIQLASTGFPSTLDEGTRKSQPLPEGPTTHPKDSGGNIQPLDMDLTSMTSNEGTAKTTLRPEGSLGEKDSGGNIPPIDMEPIHPHSFLLSEDELDKESDKEEVLAIREDMEEDPYIAEEVRTPSPKQDQPEPSHVQESTSDSSSPDLKKFDNILPLTERQLNKYLRKMSRVLFEYYDENVAHIDQTDKLVEATMCTIDKVSTAIKDLYRGLNVITKLLKDINNAVKDDLATNKKIDEAIETFSKISTNTTEVLSLVKEFDFPLFTLL
ncbi:hypothetical protein Tco_1047519, partial [Tanacetum coccineum]